MRSIFLHKQFEKKYSKLSKKMKDAFKKRRNIFIDDPHNSTLNIHPLQGEYKGCFSFNVTENIRVIYKEVKKESYIFIDIGSHSELYS